MRWGPSYFIIFAGITTLCVTAAPELKTQVKVRLFGQNCMLEGPKTFDNSTLLAIHSISPAQIPPTLNDRQAQITLERLKNVKHLPNELNSYLDALKKHLGALMAFHLGFDAATKSKKTDTFIEKVRPYLKKDAEKSLRETANLIFEEKTAVKSNMQNREELLQSYLQKIEPSPEADFHRIIRKINVHYNCTFEEGFE